MTEPPADLLDKLAKAMWNDEPPFVGACIEDADVDDEDVAYYRTRARNTLAALAEWADGALIDPSTWTRVRATKWSGEFMCSQHDDYFDPESGVCRLVAGRIFADRIFAGPCSGVPLYTLTREGP